MKKFWGLFCNYVQDYNMQNKGLSFQINIIWRKKRSIFAFIIRIKKLKHEDAVYILSFVHIFVLVIVIHLWLWKYIWTFFFSKLLNVGLMIEKYIKNIMVLLFYFQIWINERDNNRSLKIEEKSHDNKLFSQDTHEALQIKN